MVVKSVDLTQSYEWRPLSMEKGRFLSVLGNLFDSPEFELFCERGEDFSRVQADGISTLRGLVGGSRVGVVFHDFRVNGGSYGHSNSKRVCEFLHAMEKENTPTLIVLSTLGVRIMEGRTAFNSTFSIIPALDRLSKVAPIYTLALGRCLGLGAILFEQGSYRLAVANKSLMNLTGPEVQECFFGEKGNFEKTAAAEAQLEASGAVHEILPSEDAAFRRIRHLINFDTKAAAEAEHKPILPPRYLRAERNMYQLLDSFVDRHLEILSSMHGTVRTFICERGGKRFGVIISPPKNPTNMIDVLTLVKFGAALDYFKVLGLSVMSMMDTPGIDPRDSQVEKGIIREVIQVVKKIVSYPHPKMGVIVDRLYGGATVLVFPPILGCYKTIALEGAKLGIMDSSIITKLLSNSPRLSQQWQESLLSQSETLEDLVRSQNIHGVVPRANLGAEVDDFLRTRPPMYPVLTLEAHM